MATPRDSRLHRSGVHGPLPSPKNGKDAASVQDEVEAQSIEVHCPNVTCQKTYIVKGSLAGRKGRCSECGTVFPIAHPSANAAPPKAEKSPRPDGKGATQPREEPPPSGPKLTEVRTGCIGRGHAGKTALFRALAEGSIGDFFPSGLHVDGCDPREVAQMIRETEETQRLLHQCGLPPTLQSSQIRYYLYDGAAPRVAYQLREVIGQVLTHTLPDSAAQQQTQYREYLGNLVNTHVLWATVPCPPPNPGAKDRRRYSNDLRITLAYLREALRLRGQDHSVAVALVLSKIDTLFENPEDAREALSDDVLRTSLGPLVHLVEKSPQVSDAAIIPVTAFGFGNAVLSEQGGEREGAPPQSEDEPFGPEPIWLLREGTAPQPFNVETLFLWTLLFGLLNQAEHGVREMEPEIKEICGMLAEDLAAAEPWLVTLKGGVTGEERWHSPRMTTETT